MRTREQINAYHREWSRAHKEQETQRNLKWRAKNPEKWQALLKRYRDKHPTGQADNDRKRRMSDPNWNATHAAEMRAWRKQNPDFASKHCALNAERRALQLMAQPPWVKREDIVKFYIEARRLTLSTGIPHEVDHIWPLQGNGFIGLHVPWNLRVITMRENRHKKNQIPKLEGETQWQTERH